MPDGDKQEVAKIAVSLERMLPQVMAKLFSNERDSLAGNMPIAQLRVCSALFRKPHSLTELATELGISVSAATQHVDRLEKAGLAVRVFGETDRRMRIVKLTLVGESAMRQRRNMRVTRLRAALGLMEPAMLAQLVESVGALGDAAAAARSERPAPLPEVPKVA